VVIVQVTEGRAVGEGARRYDLTEAGQYYFEAGDEHEVRNAGGTPVELVEVEVRQGARRPVMRAGQSGPGGAEDMPARSLPVAWAILLTVAAAPAGAEVSRVEIATRHAVLGARLRIDRSLRAPRRTAAFHHRSRQPCNRVIVDPTGRRRTPGAVNSADLTSSAARPGAGNGVALLDM
jgi:hypothetical protein